MCSQHLPPKNVHRTNAAGGKPNDKQDMPRKFSEKIALVKQKEAESIMRFNMVMKDVQVNRQLSFGSHDSSSDQYFPKHQNTYLSSTSPSAATEPPIMTNAFSPCSSNGSGHTTSYAGSTTASNTHHFGLASTDNSPLTSYYPTSASINNKGTGPALQHRLHSTSATGDAMGSSPSGSVFSRMLSPAISTASGQLLSPLSAVGVYPHSVGHRPGVPTGVAPAGNNITTSTSGAGVGNGFTVCKTASMPDVCRGGTRGFLYHPAGERYPPHQSRLGVNTALTEDVETHFDGLDFRGTNAEACVADSRTPPSAANTHLVTCLRSLLSPVNREMMSSAATGGYPQHNLTSSSELVDGNRAAPFTEAVRHRLYQRIQQKSSHCPKQRGSSQTISPGESTPMRHYSCTSPQEQPSCNNSAFLSLPSPANNFFYLGGTSFSSGNLLNVTNSNSQNNMRGRPYEEGRLRQSDASNRTPSELRSPMREQQIRRYPKHRNERMSPYPLVSSSTSSTCIPEVANDMLYPTSWYRDQTPHYPYLHPVTDNASTLACQGSMPSVLSVPPSRQTSMRGIAPQSDNTNTNNHCLADLSTVEELLVTDADEEENHSFPVLSNVNTNFMPHQQGFSLMPPQHCGMTSDSWRRVASDSSIPHRVECCQSMGTDPSLHAVGMSGNKIAASITDATMEGSNASLAGGRGNNEPQFVPIPVNPPAPSSYFTNHRRGVDSAGCHSNPSSSSLTSFALQTPSPPLKEIGENKFNKLPTDNSGNNHEGINLWDPLAKLEEVNLMLNGPLTMAEFDNIPDIVLSMDDSCNIPDMSCRRSSSTIVDEVLSACSSHHIRINSRALYNNTMDASTPQHPMCFSERNSSHNLTGDSSIDSSMDQEGMRLLDLGREDMQLLMDPTFKHYVTDERTEDVLLMEQVFLRDPTALSN